jgi:molybdopterin-guanine dinucleotide biosynthesis protein A
MPFLDPQMIGYMVNLDPQSDIIMAQLLHGFQPMHAIYSKACLPVLQGMIEGNNLKIQDLVRNKDLSVRLVTEAEIRSVDPRVLSFLNVNTPSDLEMARKLLAGPPANLGTQR